MPVWTIYVHEIASRSTVQLPRVFNTPNCVASALSAWPWPPRDRGPCLLTNGYQVRWVWGMKWGIGLQYVWSLGMIKSEYNETFGATCAVRLPRCQWSFDESLSKTHWYQTTAKRNKARNSGYISVTVYTLCRCLFLYRVQFRSALLYSSLFLYKP